MKKIKIVEVGPRDGFQNIKEQIPTEIKVEIIRRLIDSGVRDMEITSFVNPKLVPQMADAKEVVRQVLAFAPPDFRPCALVPNLHGAEDALSAGIDTVAVVISASEGHNRFNVNKSVAESCADLKHLTSLHSELHVRLSLATTFVCPFDGVTPIARVLYVIEQAVEAGVEAVTLCDTIGHANPRQVREVIRAVNASFPDLTLGVHMHDTCGVGIANNLAAMECGITIFESCVGGLGGCPFAPGAAGNIATEDFLGMVQAMGYETGIDMDAYMDAAHFVKAHIPYQFTGRRINMCRA